MRVFVLGGIRYQLQGSALVKAGRSQVAPGQMSLFGGGNGGHRVGETKRSADGGTLQLNENHRWVKAHSDAVGKHIVKDIAHRAQHYKADKKAEISQIKQAHAEGRLPELAKKMAIQMHDRLAAATLPKHGEDFYRKSTVMGGLASAVAANGADWDTVHQYAKARAAQQNSAMTHLLSSSPNLSEAGAIATKHLADGHGIPHPEGVNFSTKKMLEAVDSHFDLVNDNAADAHRYDDRSGYRHAAKLANRLKQSIDSGGEVFQKKMSVFHNPKTIDYSHIDGKEMARHAIENADYEQVAAHLRQLAKV